MTLKDRDLVTIDDFSNAEIGAVFAFADELSKDITCCTDMCKGKIMASLFFEPSTRTRLSFEAAMHRLGGSVISAMDIGATSLAKGESIADMAKVVGGYADIIVIRHPWEGAAKVVADFAGVPVINAGDGGHQHPTQTLLDLYTIRKERGGIKGLNIALWGDLKYGRTTHSLIFALAKFGANILFCPSPGLEVPEHVIHKLVTEYGGNFEKHDENKSARFPVNAIYTTPSQPHQLAMVPGVNVDVELRGNVDALYVTRPQRERFGPAEREQNGRFPVVDKELLQGDSFRKTLVMHPLPRVDELAYEMDSDPRSLYFKQAAFGVPVRMALIAGLLGAGLPETPRGTADHPDYQVYSRTSGPACANPKCVSAQTTEARYLKPAFKIVSRDPLTLRCIYCEHGMEPPYVADSDGDKCYFAARSPSAAAIRPENLVIFDSDKSAQAQGFQPARAGDSG